MVYVYCPFSSFEHILNSYLMLNILMVDFSKMSFLSEKQQKVIFLLSQENEICYKNQEVYRNERSFYKAMNQLVRSKILKLRIDIHTSTFFYSLTNEGRKVLIEYGVVPLERGELQKGGKHGRNDQA